MRRSKNITKPLHEVLIRQTLWQVNQLSTNKNEPSREDPDFQNSSDVSQTTEKCISIESAAMGVKHPEYHCEVTAPSEQHIVQKRSESNNEIMATRLTQYHDDQFHDGGGDFGQRYLEPNDVFVGMYNKTNGSEMEEYRYPKWVSSYERNTDDKTEYCQLVNLKKQHKNDLSSSGQSNKLTQFKGVLKKIKQGCYTNNSTTTCQSLNISYSSMPTEHSSEKKNDYIRSILNGIPINKHNAYNSPFNENNSNKTNKSQNPNYKSTDFNEPHRYPSNVKDELTLGLNPQNNLMNNESAQMDTNTCMKGKDSTVLDNHTHMLNIEDLKSSNYNLRNGVNQSSPSNSKFVVNCQYTESQRNKQSYTPTNGFISDNEYAFKDKPIKSEYPVSKNCSLQSLNSDKKTVDDIEQKSVSEKIINNNNNSSIFSKDIPKDNYDVKSHKNNTEVESALKNEFTFSTSEHSKLNDTESKVNSSQIESYYQSDRQSKVSDKIKPNDKFSAETNMSEVLNELENLKQYIPKITDKKSQRKYENYEQNKHPSNIAVKSSSFKPQLNSQGKNNNLVINSTISKLKTNPLQQELTINKNNEANSNNFKLKGKDEDVLKNKVNYDNAGNMKIKMEDLKQKMAAHNSIHINNKYKLTSQNSPKTKITLDKSQVTKDKIPITKDKTQVISKKFGEKERNEDMSVKKMLAPILPVTNGSENVNKPNSKPGSKEEFSKNVDNIQTEQKPAVIKEGSTITTGTKDIGKCEAAQSKIGYGSLNNVKSNDFQNNINKKIEPQLNISASPSDIKTSGKSTAGALHLMKNDVAGKEEKITQVSSFKPAELKKTTSLIKVSKEKDNNLSLSKSVEKLAAMLKEHRMLLELLFEKLNCRLVSFQGDTKVGYKSLLQTNEELYKPDQKSYDTDGDKNVVQFKEVFNKRLLSGEKLRRVPRNNSQSIELKNVTTTKATKIGKSPLQRFNMVTMLTSPSRRQLKKKSVEPVIDGSKLANYNFSPLKQILSQYKIDLHTKLPRLSQSSFFETSPEYNTFGKNQIRDKRIDLPYNKLPNNVPFTSFTNPVRKNNKSKEDYSQIKKTVTVNKNKNYSIRYNIKKHLILKNINSINTVPKVVKSSKKDGSLKKKDKTIDKKNKDELINNKRKKKGNAISKGPILEFAYAHQKKPQRLTADYGPKILTHQKVLNRVTKKPINVKIGSLKNAKKPFKFIKSLRSSSHSKTSSGSENKFTIFNSEYSNNMLNGSTWVSSPEFNVSKIQLNLSKRTTSTNNEKNRINIKQADNIYPPNTNLLHSATNNLSLSKVLPFTSKGAIPKPSFAPVLQSSTLPLILSLSNSRSMNKSNIYSSKTVGIKKISTCNIGKFENERAKSKPFRNLSYPIRPHVPSVITEKKNRTNHDTVTTKSKETEHGNLGLHKKKHSLDARNNLLFGRNETPYILTTMKPSFLSFRTISHKDSTPTSQGKITLKEEELNMLPFKDPSVKTVINDHYLKLLHQVHNLKTTWVKISDKVKSMVENKTGVKGSCKPNFDEIMASATEDRESICQKDPRHFSKQTRSKHSLATTTEINISRNLKFQGKTKKVRVSNFLNNGVKNF